MKTAILRRIDAIKDELRRVRDYRIEAQLRFELIDLLFKLRTTELASL